MVAYARWTPMYCPRCHCDIDVPTDIFKAQPIQVCDYQGCKEVLVLHPPEPQRYEFGCALERALRDHYEI